MPRRAVLRLRMPEGAPRGAQGLVLHTERRSNRRYRCSVTGSELKLKENGHSAAARGVAKGAKTGARYPPKKGDVRDLHRVGAYADPKRSRTQRAGSGHFWPTFALGALGALGAFGFAALLRPFVAGTTPSTGCATPSLRSASSCP